MSIFQIVTLFFIAALLLVISLYIWYVTVTTSPRHEVRKRLRRLAVDAENRRFPSELRIEILGEMSAFDKALFKLGIVRRLDLLVEKAGLKVDVKLIMMAMAVTAVFGFVVGLFLERGLAPALVLLVVGALLPIVFLRYKRGNRIQRFTEQFPDTLDMVSRSLKAGHSLTSAIQMVGEEMPEPVSGVFRAAYEEQALGVSTREAVSHMTDRIASLDLRFFVMAINIHREIGGNLGEVLERLAKTIRERLVIRRQVKVYTAQARLSGYILAVVPIAMAIMLYFTAPGYVEELFKVRIGWYAIAGAVLAQIIGFMFIRRIINIRI